MEQSHHPKLHDQHQRKINYLRISITDRCNLKCVYCMPRTHTLKLTHKDVLRYEEILRLVRIGVTLGITKVRVTGGEPLVRKGVYDFLSNLTSIKELSDISITTNGILFKDNIDKIKTAGIKRINFSLDTLKKDKFEKITGYDAFDKVWEGIEAALDLDFKPVKVNVVALNGINDDEFVEMARLTFSYPIHLRFIEQMPIGAPSLRTVQPILAPEIKQRISEPLGKLIPVENGVFDGPAQRFKFEGSMGEIGFIRPLSRHFCNKCNRLRLTAGGRLRPCLLSDHYEDLKGPLRSGCLDKDLVKIFNKAVHHKPAEHHLADEDSSNVKVLDQMHSIGG